MNVKTQDTNQTILLHVNQDHSLLDAAEEFLQLTLKVEKKSPDVHLINLDQTSIKIAQVRELKQLLSYHPYQSEKTIVCLLWADLATQAAQNALLKSLEEPPAHSRCILVTHNPSSLLPTIQSRCLEIKSNQTPTENQTDTFPNVEEILNGSYDQSINLATTYKERAQAQALIKSWLKQLHQNQDYPQQKLVMAATQLLKTQQLLEQNINVQLALESCFFSIVTYNRGAVKNIKS